MFTSPLQYPNNLYMKEIEYSKERVYTKNIIVGRFTGQLKVEFEDRNYESILSMDGNKVVLIKVKISCIVGNKIAYEQITSPGFTEIELPKIELMFRDFLKIEDELMCESDYAESKLEGFGFEKIEHYNFDTFPHILESNIEVGNEYENFKKLIDVQ